MLVVLSLLASIVGAPAQDEIVRAGPAYTAHVEQACMYGGQPVACPQPAPVEPAAPAADEDEERSDNPWDVVTTGNFENTTTNRPDAQPPPEGGYSRSRGIRGTASFDPNAPPTTSASRRRVFVNDPDRDRDQTAPSSPEAAPATGEPAPAFDWSARARSGQQTPYPAAEYQAGADPADRDRVPAWAFGDPERYELDQCGPGTSEPTALCRRNARNRLASARAETAIPDDTRPEAAAPQSRGPACRTVTAPTGNGATASVICGNGDADALVESMLDRAERLTAPVVADCQRPLEGEDTARWMARCQTPRP